MDCKKKGPGISGGRALYKRKLREWKRSNEKRKQRGGDESREKDLMGNLSNASVVPGNRGKRIGEGNQS